MGTKKAEVLDLALGCLYTQYGPSLEKRASLSQFAYRLNKDSLDEEALGHAFCKLAKASRIDPWDMARRVVQSYPTLMKSASSPEAQELIQFYEDWAEEIIKKANLLTGVGNIMRKGKAVGSALVGNRGSLRSAKHLAQQGVVKSEMGGVGKTVGRTLKRQNTLQQMGGGSIARGQKVHAQNAAQRAARPASVAKPTASDAVTVAQNTPTDLTATVNQSAPTLVSGAGQAAGQAAQSGAGQVAGQATGQAAKSVWRDPRFYGMAVLGGGLGMGMGNGGMEPAY